MKVLRIVGIGIGALVLLVALVAFGARFADGPIAVFPGGPFTSGDLVEDPKADLSFAADIPEIELQSGAPPTSRTVWVVVHGGGAYVPCSLGFPPGKSWHRKALSNPEAVVRIGGKRYRRVLARVEDDALHEKLIAAAGAKYGNLPGADPSQVWFFHLAPPGS